MIQGTVVVYCRYGLGCWHGWNLGIRGELCANCVLGLFCKAEKGGEGAEGLYAGCVLDLSSSLSEGVQAQAGTGTLERMLFMSPAGSSSKDSCLVIRRKPPLPTCSIVGPIFQALAFSPIV